MPFNAMRPPKPMGQGGGAPSRPAMGPIKPKRIPGPPQVAAKPAAPVMGMGGGMPQRPAPQLKQAMFNKARAAQQPALAGQRFLPQQGGIVPPQMLQQDQMAQQQRQQDFQKMLAAQQEMGPPPMESLGAPGMMGPEPPPPQFGQMGAPEMQEMGGRLQELLNRRRMGVMG